MRFINRVTYYPKPYEPNHFIQKHEFEVNCFCSEIEEDVVAGLLRVDFLDIDRVEMEHAELCHVCDADSEEWEYVYSATIEPSPDLSGLRRDFEFDDHIEGIVYIRTLVLHPAIRDWQNFIIDAVCRYFPESTGIVMRRDTTTLSDRDLVSLGFRRVAGWDLYFRPNMLRTGYSAANDTRDPLTDINIPEDAFDYVLEHIDEDY